MAVLLFHFMYEVYHISLKNVLPTFLFSRERMQANLYLNEVLEIFDVSYWENISGKDDEHFTVVTSTKKTLIN